MNAARTNAEDKIHCKRPNGDLCLAECGIGLAHAPSCPVAHPQIAAQENAALEALHELTWTIAIAGQGERGELVPPCIGEARYALAQRAIALIEGVGRG